METNVTTETAQKVRRWINAQKNFNRAEQEKSRAATELSNAQNELGKFLVPDPSEKGEVFNIWFGSGIIQAVRQSDSMGSYTISWRKEMSPKERMEMQF